MKHVFKQISYIFAVIYETLSSSSVFPISLNLLYVQEVLTRFILYLTIKNGVTTSWTDGIYLTIYRTYYIKWVQTSWKRGKLIYKNGQDFLEI